MSEWYDALEALRPKHEEEQPRVRRSVSRSWILVIAASLGAVVIAVASSGGAFLDRGRAGDETAVPLPTTTATATVRGLTLTRTSPTTTTVPSPSPSVTVTTIDAFAAALAAATPPAGSTSSTTTTSPPGAITPASASSAAPGATLLLDAAPAAASRALDLRLSVHFEDFRVLRTARVDFGDGKAVDGAVQPWACGAPDAPNPYVVTVPTYAYRAPGSYVITVTATTAACSLEDDDWGPDEPAEVRLNISVP